MFLASLLSSEKTNENAVSERWHGSKYPHPWNRLIQLIDRLAKDLAKTIYCSSVQSRHRVFVCGKSLKSDRRSPTLRDAVWVTDLGQHCGSGN